MSPRTMAMNLMDLDVIELKCKAYFTNDLNPSQVMTEPCRPLWFWGERGFGGRVPDQRERMRRQASHPRIAHLVWLEVSLRDEAVWSFYFYSIANIWRLFARLARGGCVLFVRNGRGWGGVSR